ncbi:MAG: hypothetical protein IT354_20930 [Gemmatimonadaceae bacterium]|nr:hypothetical protein [Gemmatimonadaceae bacterium]
MVIEAHAPHLSRLVGNGGAHVGGGYRYRMFGLDVVSDRPIGGLMAAEADRTGAPDVAISWPGPESRCPTPQGLPTASLACEHGTTIITRYDDARGSWLRHRSFGTFFVSADARDVAVYPRAGVDPAMLDGTLTSQVPIFVLQRRQRPSLHASAVVTDVGAAVFLGPKGQGKSTMAALFLRHGAALLADDTLPLRLDGGAAFGSPSLPSMRLFPESASQTLDVHDSLPHVAPNHDKRHLTLDDRFRFAAGESPIRAIYALARRSVTISGDASISIRALSGRDSLALLLAQTSVRSLLRPIELAPLMRAYQALVTATPLRVVEFPDGFEYQDGVYAALRADMVAR